MYRGGGKRVGKVKIEHNAQTHSAETKHQHQTNTKYFSIKWPFLDVPTYTEVRYVNPPSSLDRKSSKSIVSYPLPKNWRQLFG